MDIFQLDNVGSEEFIPERVTAGQRITFALALVFWASAGCLLASILRLV
jgi:hypothetical protein